MWGNTYAIQFAPTIEIVSWNHAHCIGNDSCQPFHDSGSVVLSLGYIIVSMIYYPLGTGNLKETMTMQVVAFVSLVFFIVVFCYKFYSLGLSQTISPVGGEISRLAGLVL